MTTKICFFILCLSITMKRIASLFLLVTLFYNALGYYLMFAYQEEQAWVSAVQNSPHSEFKIIELNATLYSFIEDTDFEYVNENVVIENKSYHIFKKRIQNNILSLYYLPNTYGDIIGKDLNDIVDNQLFNSNSSKDSPVKKLLKTFLQDYIPSYSTGFNFILDSNLALQAYNLIPKTTILQGHLSLLFTPPKLN